MPNDYNHPPQRDNRTNASILVDKFTDPVLSAYVNDNHRCRQWKELVQENPEQFYSLTGKPVQPNEVTSIVSYRDGLFLVQQATSKVCTIDKTLSSKWDERKFVPCLFRLVSITPKKFFPRLEWNNGADHDYAAINAEYKIKELLVANVEINWEAIGYAQEHRIDHPFREFISLVIAH